jgi:uncharacterized protein (TIGR02996 family)
MRAFLADVRENPEDDTPRLILADWLDEYGGPADQARADLIRTQIEKARLPPGHPHHFVLAQRERELVQRWGSAWVGPLLDRVRSLRHERGMVLLTLSCGMLQARGLLELRTTEVWSWVLGARLENVTPREAHSLARCPLLEDLALLSVSGELGTSGLHALVESPGVRHLVQLDLVSNRLHRREAQILARSAHLGRLRELDLTSNHLGDDGAEALSGSLRPGLVRLSLARNAIGDAGGVALAGSPALVHLRELHLGDNQVSDLGARALARSLSLERIGRLVLWGNPIGASGVTELQRRFGSAVFLTGERGV